MACRGSRVSRSRLLLLLKHTALHLSSALTLSLSLSPTSRMVRASSRSPSAALTWLSRSCAQAQAHLRLVLMMLRCAIDTEAVGLKRGRRVAQLGRENSLDPRHV